MNSYDHLPVLRLVVAGMLDFDIRMLLKYPLTSTPRSYLVKDLGGLGFMSKMGSRS